MKNLNNQSIFVYSSMLNKVTEINKIPEIVERTIYNNFISTLENNKKSIKSINDNKIDRDTEIVIDLNNGNVKYISRGLAKKDNLLMSKLELSTNKLDYTNTSNEFTKRISIYAAFTITSMLFEGINDFNQTFNFSSNDVVLRSFGGKAKIYFKTELRQNDLVNPIAAKAIFLANLAKEIKL